MAAGQYRTLSKRIVDRLAVDDKDAVFRDREEPRNLRGGWGGAD